MSSWKVEIARLWTEFCGIVGDVGMIEVRGEKDSQVIQISTEFRLTSGVCAFVKLAGILARRFSYVVCNRGSREKGREPIGASSVQGQPVSRATGQARTVYSAGGLPGDSVLFGEWIFAVDEQ
jgi:hypothetical protein